MHLQALVCSPNHSLLNYPITIILSSSSFAVPAAFPIKNGICCFTKRVLIFNKKSPPNIVLKSSSDDNNNNNYYNYWEEEEEEEEYCEEDDDDDESTQLVDKNKNKNDSFYMRRCIELAKKGIGHTGLDPMVGCVVVKDDVIIGEGFYSKAGETHAQVLAMREAGNLGHGATAYMNLDPCNDQRPRVQDCISMLLKTNRVVVGMRDPNPVVNLKGVEALRKCYRSVSVGVDQKLCEKLNEAYIHRKLSGKPFLTLRCSVTINGRILDELGEGAKECGGYYSRLLNEYDGVIVSSASLKDKSSFPTSKEPGAKQPMQIIVTTPPEVEQKVANIVLPAAAADHDHETTSGQDAEEEEDQIIEQKLALNTKYIFPQGNITKDLRKIIDYCARRGLCSVLFDLHRNSKGLEDILEEGLELGLFQKVVMEVLPFWDSSIRENTLQQLINTLEKRGLKLSNSPLRITTDSVVVEGYFE